MKAQTNCLDNLWDALPALKDKAQSGAEAAEERRWIGDDLANDLLEAGVGRILLDQEVRRARWHAHRLP